MPLCSEIHPLVLMRGIKKKDRKQGDGTISGRSARSGRFRLRAFLLKLKASGRSPALPTAAVYRRTARRGSLLEREACYEAV